jgi:hypothetical protein
MRNGTGQEWGHPARPGLHPHLSAKCAYGWGTRRFEVGQEDESYGWATRPRGPEISWLRRFCAGVVGALPSGWRVS